MSGADTMGISEATQALEGVTELRKQIDSMEERLTECQNSLDGQSKCAFCQQTAEYVQRMEILESQCENLKENLKSLQNASVDLERKYRKFDELHTSNHSKLESRVQACEVDSGEKQHDIEHLKQDMSMMRNNYSEQKSRLDKAMETITRLSQDNRNLQHQNHSLEVRCNNLIARLSDRFLLVKLLGQLFVPPTFIPEMSSDDQSSPEARSSRSRSNSERNMESIADHFVSGQLEQYLQSFKKHIDDDIEKAKKHFDETSGTVGGRLNGIDHRLAHLENAYSTSMNVLDGKIQKLESKSSGIQEQYQRDMDRFKDRMNQVEEAMPSLRGEMTRISKKVDLSLQKTMIEINNTLARSNQDLQDQINDVESDMRRIEKDFGEQHQFQTKEVNDAKAKAEEAVRWISKTNTDVKNYAATVVENFKHLQYELNQMVLNDSLPVEFSDWSVKYVCQRLRGEPDLSAWEYAPLPEVQKLVQLVSEFMRTSSLESFWRYQGHSFADCLIAPKCNEDYQPSLHTATNMKPRKGDEGSYVVQYLNAPGLMLPKSPEMPIKAEVMLKRKSSLVKCMSNEAVRIESNNEDIHLEAADMRSPDRSVSTQCD